MNGAIVVYMVYLLCAVALIVWLGMQLHRDGRIFLDDVFAHQPTRADAISKLLVTGFVVFTLGYALLLLRIDAAATTEAALRTSVGQFGVLLLSLGALHSLNMLILLGFRRRTAADAADARRSRSRLDR